MGLTARKEVLQWLRATAPRAFLTSIPFMAMWVLVEDFLTRAPRMRGPKYDGTYTGDELFNDISSPVLRFLRATCRVVVLACDDQYRVPKRKWIEQQKRDKQAAERKVAKEQKQSGQGKGKSKPKNQKKRLQASDCAEIEAKCDALATAVASAGAMSFAPDSLIEDAGLRRPSETTARRFALFPLTRQRGLRPALMGYLAMRFQQLALPLGRRVILDYDAKGPLEFFSFCNSLPRVRLLGDYQHPFGEADLSCVYWIAVYGRTHDVLYMSVDSDCLPTTIHLVWQLRLHEIKGRRILWNDAMGTIIDICEVVRVLEPMGITPVHLAAVFAFPGCDWVEGTPLCPRPEGGDHTRIFRGMANYGMFAVNDARLWEHTLPLDSKEECVWRQALQVARQELCMPFLGYVRPLCQLIGEYTAPAPPWDGERQTTFEFAVYTLCANLLGLRKMDLMRKDPEQWRKWRHEAQSLAWATQYWCVPWLEIGVPRPPWDS